MKQWALLIDLIDMYYTSLYSYWLAKDRLIRREIVSAFGGSVTICEVEQSAQAEGLPHMFCLAVTTKLFREKSRSGEKVSFFPFLFCPSKFREALMLTPSGLLSLESNRIE